MDWALTLIGTFLLYSVNPEPRQAIMKADEGSNPRLLSTGYLSGQRPLLRSLKSPQRCWRQLK